MDFVKSVWKNYLIPVPTYFVASILISLSKESGNFKINDEGMLMEVNLAFLSQQMLFFEI